MKNSSADHGVHVRWHLSRILSPLALLVCLAGCGHSDSAPSADNGQKAVSLATVAAQAESPSGPKPAFALANPHHLVDAGTGWEPKPKMVPYPPDFQALRDEALKLEQGAVDCEVRGDFAAGRKDRQRVIDIQTKIYGPRDWHVIRPATMLAELEWQARLPQERRNAFGQARGFGGAGLVLRSQGKIADAAKKLQMSADMLRRLGPDAKGTLYVRLLMEWAFDCEALAQFTLADELLCEAVPLSQKLNGPNSADTVALLQRLVRVKRRLGQLDDAYNIGRNVLDLYCDNTIDDLPEYAHCLNSLGLVCLDLKDHKQAEPLFLKAIEITENNRGKNPFNEGERGMSLLALAEVYEETGEVAAAERPAQRAIEILMNVLGTDSDEYAAVEAVLGHIYVHSGRLAQAEPLLKHAVAISTGAHGADDFWSADDQQYLGEFFLAKQDYAAAEPLLARAIKIKETALGPNHPGLAEPLKSYAKLLRATGRTQEADSTDQRIAEMGQRLAAVRDRLDRR